MSQLKLKRYFMRLLICLYCLLSVKYASAQAPCYTLEPKTLQHDFVLVIDRSGSMSGLPLQQAIRGAQAFIGNLKTGDRGAIVAFGSEVRVVKGLTNDRKSLLQALGSIKSFGNTVLYDGLVKAASLAIQGDSNGIVVFLTDGIDTGSRYTARDLESIGRTEGVYMYGIGLGTVDEVLLRKISNSTGGMLETTADPNQLESLYDRVLASYYDSYGKKLRKTSSYVVRSMPSGRTVSIGGKTVGVTPLKLDNWKPGNHKVEVEFERGIWSCQSVAEQMHRTTIDAREDGIGRDVWVVSRPKGASVFVDDVYVGMTSIRPVQTSGDDWAEKIKKDVHQLRIPLLSRGKHTLRILTMPDFDYGSDQELSFPILIDDTDRVISVDVFQGNITYQDGSKKYVRGRSGVENAFEELDALLQDR